MNGWPASCFEALARGNARDAAALDFDTLARAADGSTWVALGLFAAGLVAVFAATWPAFFTKARILAGPDRRSLRRSSSQTRG